MAVKTQTYRTARLEHFMGLSARFTTYLRTLQRFAQEVENEMGAIRESSDPDVQRFIKKVDALIDAVVVDSKTGT